MAEPGTETVAAVEAPRQRLELLPAVAELALHFADHKERYGTGDAYFAPPGHIPVVSAGTEIIEFSRTDEYAHTMEVLASNLAALSGA